MHWVGRKTDLLAGHFDWYYNAVATNFHEGLSRSGSAPYIWPSTFRVVSVCIKIP